MPETKGQPPFGFDERTKIGTLDVPHMGIGSISWGLRGIGGLVDQLERTFLLSSGATNAAEPVPPEPCSLTESPLSSNLSLG